MVFSTNLEITLAQIQFMYLSSDFYYSKICLNLHSHHNSADSMAKIYIAVFIYV